MKNKVVKTCTVLICALAVLSILPPQQMNLLPIGPSLKTANAQVTTLLPFIGGIITSSRRCPCSFIQGRAVTILTSPFGIPATVYISDISGRWTRGRIIPANPVIVAKIPFFIEHCRKFDWPGCQTIATPDGFTLRHGPGTPGGQP